MLDGVGLRRLRHAPRRKRRPLGHPGRPESMRTNYLAGILLITVAGACGDQTQRGGHSSAGASSTSSRSIVGRWALDSFVINGEDWTKGMKARGTVAYYTLNRDGTFRITMGDSVLETGTWSQDTTTSPMIFDHIPNVTLNATSTEYS